jgi:hypothetical protein
VAATAAFLLLLLLSWLKTLGTFRRSSWLGL